MKKALLTLCLFGTILAASAQIPNSDFENWTKIQAEKPTGWDLFLSTTGKTTDKHSGSYAIKLQGDTGQGNDFPGAILMGGSDNGVTFYGGEPFAAKPDSIIFWARYNIATGDTGLVYLQLKKAGAALSAGWYKITGSSAAYKRMAFKINYKVSQTADSIILAFLSTNVQNGGPTNAASSLIIDDISFAGTSVNIVNPGFENWSNFVHYKPDGWLDYYTDFDLLAKSPESILQTTDHAKGSFAMIVQNNVTATDTITGYTRTGDESQFFGPTFPIGSRKDTLYCLYKWLRQKTDTMQISLNLYKQGNTVGGAYYYQGPSTPVWTILKIPITFFNGTDIPDSGTINVISSYNQPTGNSKLYVDNFSFSPVFGAGIHPITKKEVIIVYPNPAADKLNLILPESNVQYHAAIMDMRGVVVKNLLLTDEKTSIDISGFAAGIYTIQLQENGVAVRFVKK